VVFRFVFGRVLFFLEFKMGITHPFFIEFPRKLRLQHEMQKYGVWWDESLCDGHINNVITKPMLSDGDDNRLVGCAGHDGTHPVCASGQTSRNRSLDISLRIRGTVDTLEESELGRVRDRGRIQGGNSFNNDVRVSNDLALRVERLGVGEISLGRVRELTELDVLGLERDVERGVGLDGRAVGRGLEFSRGDVRCRGNLANRDRVARPGGGLQAIGNGQRRKSRSTEVNEVVLRRLGRSLAGYRGVLTVIGGLDYRGVEGQRILVGGLTGNVAGASVGRG